MNAGSLSYTEVPRATALYLDYLYHFERVQKFYQASPFEIGSYQEVARRLAAHPGDRESLVDILTRQNEALACSESTLANIRRLREAGVFAVVTGQQVGLFSGPAFTLYKALTAVRISQHLTSCGLECVPVFWLATEDHDFEEVAKARVLDEAGDLVELRDQGSKPASHSSVGYITLSPQITRTMDRLEQIFPPGEPRDKVMSDLRECYVPGSRWGEAFGRLMARLFSRFGVVMIDPLNERVHQAASAGYRRAIHEADSFREHLQKRTKELQASGYHAQVHIADDSTLLFATLDGNRAAIRQKDSHFYVEGNDGRAAGDVEAWIARRPLDFSPSALLRPVIQDTLLPTVAYIAGPAELAYLGQAQVLYKEFGRPMPVIVPRAGFTLADHRIARLLDKYQLTLEDVWKGEEHLRRRIASAAATGGPHEASSTEGGRAVLDDPDPVFTPNASGTAQYSAMIAANSENWVARLEQSQQAVRRLFADLGQDVKPIDPTLVDAVRHGEEKVMYQLDRLKGKISRAAIQHSEVLRRHEQDLMRVLTPAANLQEREVSGISFLARAGYELLDRLLPEIYTTSAAHRLFIY
jgi:bacillithiol biosynthesis cysteine-adding enzyme BshC